MQIDLTGQTARIAGAAGPVCAALGDRLANSGATLIGAGVPDLLILSAPLVKTAGFDWASLSDNARDMGAAMQARGAGRILVLLPACAALPMRRTPVLSMQAAALLAVVRTLAMTVAPQVAVNALGLGAISEGEAPVSGNAAMIGHASVGHASVGGAGSLAKACDTALFLCDRDDTYLTGQMLTADGGWAAGYGRSF